MRLEGPVPTNITTEISISGLQNLTAVYQSMPNQKTKMTQYRIGKIYFKELLAVTEMEQ